MKNTTIKLPDYKIPFGYDTELRISTPLKFKSQFIFKFHSTIIR